MTKNLMAISKKPANGWREQANTILGKEASLQQLTETLESAIFNQLQGQYNVLELAAVLSDVQETLLKTILEISKINPWSFERITESNKVPFWTSPSSMHMYTCEEPETTEGLCAPHFFWSRGEYHVRDSSVNCHLPYFNFGKEEERPAVMGKTILLSTDLEDQGEWREAASGWKDDMHKPTSNGGPTQSANSYPGYWDAISTMLHSITMALELVGTAGGCLYVASYFVSFIKGPSGKA